MHDLRLYLVCHHFEALVASQLPPDQFARYLAMGLRRATDAEDIFLEIKPDALAGSAFDAEKIRKVTVSHEDGSPKRSKYISIYRVLEHLPMASLGNLYLTTRDGSVLEIAPETYSDAARNGANMYLELCPASPLVVSPLDPVAYLRHMTDPANPLSVPKLLMVDMRLERQGDQLASDLPYPHPEHIFDCLDEVQSKGKPLKIVSRRPRVPGFFRTIRRGFFVGNGAETKFYPYPTPEQFDSIYHRWWRSAQMG